jgi:putative transposase|tara:strand:+ start:246 stop:896 length:651 start_codon:yes stop_codon:yes gene_type:complete
MGRTNTNWDRVNLFEDRINRVDCKEHFRLKKYEVTLKEIAKVRFGNHCKYNVNYHFVWIPKTRMKILVEPFKTYVAEQIEVICSRNYWRPLALEIMPDHLHFFLSAHPKWAPMKIVQLLKQETSKKLRNKYASIRDTRFSKDFWATGYYCGTAGHVSADQVARYIMEQTRELKNNWNLFDIRPFEYDINEVKEVDSAQKSLDAFGIGGFNSALRFA